MVQRCAIEQTGSSRTHSNKSVSSNRWSAFAIGHLTAAAVARVGGSKLAVVMAMGGDKSFLVTTVGICATDKQRFEQHFGCYDSPADSEQSSFPSCNFQSYSLLESRYSQKSAFNHMVSISNVSWMHLRRVRMEGIKLASFRHLHKH